MTTTMTHAQTPKQQAYKLIEQLPDSATWSELAYRLEVRADIEEGLEDIKAGRITPLDEVRREFDLSK